MGEELFINTIGEDQVLNSYNIARNCDIVYSEIISIKNFNQLNIKEYNIIFNDGTKVFYSLKNFNLKENDVIFCNTYLINSLFSMLKKNKTLKNIKLITHQTDLAITKKVFVKKPDCVSEWYSINVSHESEKLISIPIGLSNDYSPKNIFKKDYKDLKSIDLENKENKIYANFQKNTNNKVRENLEKKMLNKDSIVHDTPMLSSKNYLLNLHKFKFVIAPEGNGIDTHRIWESIYAGSIPVIKKHINFKNFNDLPILQLNNLDQVDIYNLEKISSYISEEMFLSNKLSIKYWIDLINMNKISKKNAEFIFKQNDFKNNFYVYKYKINEKLNSKFKKFKYNLRRVRNRLQKLFTLK